MAVAFVDHSASVLVVAARHDVAAPVLDHFFDQGIAFGFSRPADLALASGRVHARHRMALVLDVDVGDRVRHAAQALSRELPCVLVSDAPLPQRDAFHAVMHTDTSPADLFDTVRGVLAGRSTDTGLVGAAPGMQQVRALIERVAHRMTPVLLQGETGVGKAVAAREIHRRSGRAGAFVALDCAQISDAQLDIELLGAPGPRSAGSGMGYLGAAQGGTLLLDEVSRMSPLFQARLLGLLESGVYRRAGEAHTRALDVRLVATSRGQLSEAVAAGQLRPDLFYRLAVFPIRVPPLRERAEDIVALIDTLAVGLPGGRPRFDAMAIVRLQSQAWPGNVRELANVVERLAIICAHDSVDRATLDQHLDPLADGRGIAELAPVPPQSSPDTQIAAMALPDAGVDLRALVEQLEKRLIEQALKRNGHVVAHAARALGLRRTTLTEKLRRYAISTA